MLSMFPSGIGRLRTSTGKMDVRREKLSVYNAVLDEFIMDDPLSRLCRNAMTEKIHQDYVNGAIDELTYLSMADSLKEAVRKGDQSVF